MLQHQVFSHVPLLDRLSDLSVSSSGGFYTLDRGGGSEIVPDLPFARTHGGGFRGLYDLADPDKSRFMIATGESGHIFSRHYGDLTPLWNDVKSITLAGSEDELKKAGAQELSSSSDAYEVRRPSQRQPHARRNPAVAGALSSE